MRTIAFLLIILWGRLLLSQEQQEIYDPVYSQEYLERSTKFAWTTFGLDALQSGGGNADLRTGSATPGFDFRGPTMTRATIGGMHFWGHADFYVTFPLGFATWTPDVSEVEQLLYEQGIETGARYYPWALTTGKLRPYVGLSFRAIAFGYEPLNSGFTESFPLYRRFTVPLDIGLSYATQKYMFSVGAYIQPDLSFAYALSTSEMGQVSLDPFSLRLAILKTVDSDRHARLPGAISSINRTHEQMIKDKKLSAFYVGIGPSASLQTGDNDFFDEQFPHLSGDRTSAFNLDLTAGYYFEPIDANLGVSYRGMNNEVKAIDDVVASSRRSYMLEGYKFLFNYHGFLPFLGLTGSLEQLTVDVNGQVYDDLVPAVGVVFGWDIRVIKTENSLLRTNLRYVPNLHVDINGDRMSFDHLEFNFIQYVRFIGRSKYKKSKGI